MKKLKEPQDFLQALVAQEIKRRADMRERLAIQLHDVHPDYRMEKHPGFFKEDDMKEYIGTKIVKARPANRLEFETSMMNRRQSDSTQRGLENVLAEGYIVEYSDGYTSWSPKRAFEDAYRETSGGMTFGLAIEAMKDGKKVAREGWNGKGMFIYITAGSVVPKKRLKPETAEKLSGFCSPTATINAHIDMKTADNSVVVGWLASQTDMLAEDWMIVE